MKNNTIIMRKKLLIPIITGIVSITLLIILYTSSLSLGSIINNFFPCEQAPENSFPCFGIYDIYAMIFLVMIVIVSLIIFGINFYKSKKWSRKE